MPGPANDFDPDSQATGPVEHNPLLGASSSADSSVPGWRAIGCSALIFALFVLWVTIQILVR